VRRVGGKSIKEGGTRIHPPPPTPLDQRVYSKPSRIHHKPPVTQIASRQNTTALTLILVVLVTLIITLTFPLSLTLIPLFTPTLTTLCVRE
jgi:hypothetical protein